LERNWFAAQIARFTAAGASAGAKANPKRRRAKLPETIGPDAGKSFANEGMVATARITTLKNFLGITKLINSFSALAMPKIVPVWKRKFRYQRWTKVQARFGTIYAL
jgi:hypothetical protein